MNLQVSDVGFILLVATYAPAFTLLGRLARGAVPEKIPSESYGKVIVGKIVFAILLTIFASSTGGFSIVSGAAAIVSAPGPGYYVASLILDIVFLAVMWRGEFYTAAKIIIFNLLHIPFLTLAAAAYAVSREQGKTVGMVRSDLPAAKNAVLLGYAVKLMRKVRKPVRGVMDVDVRPTNDVRLLPYEEPVYYSPRVEGNVLNPHMIIAGASGAGKTTTVYRLVRELSKSYPVIFVDVKGDVTRALLADKVDSRIVPVSLVGLDPFAPTVDNESERDGLEDLMAAISVVEEVGSRQAHFIREAYAEIYHSGRELTYSAVVEALDRREKESLAPDSRWGPGTRDALYSISSKIKDLSEYLRDGGPSVRKVLDMVIGEKRESDFPVAVFNLEGVDEKIRAIILELILRKLSRYLQRRGPLAYLKDKPIVLVVDEAYLVTRPMERGRSGESRSVLEEIARAGRSYGVALILVTQRLSDIADGIRQNCDRWVLFRTSSPDDVRVMEVDESVVREVITQLEKGFAYIRIVTGRRIDGIKYTADVTAPIIGYIFRMERAELRQSDDPYTACHRCGLLASGPDYCSICRMPPLPGPPPVTPARQAERGAEATGSPGGAPTQAAAGYGGVRVDWEEVKRRAIEKYPQGREKLEPLTIDEIRMFVTSYPNHPINVDHYIKLGLVRSSSDGKFTLKKAGGVLLEVYREVVAGK